MSDEPTDGPIIETLEELIAQAIQLENEAVACYEELADAMDVHNNPEVAGMLRQLAGYGRMHAAEMEERGKDMDLPRRAPWEFHWEDAPAPESAEMEAAHYMMTPFHALSIAMRAEKGALQFYAGIAARAADPKVKELAAEFAEEEGEHVTLLEKWMKGVEAPAAGWDHDPDPANTPE